LQKTVNLKVQTTNIATKKNDSSFILFNLVTDYVMICLMLVKLWYGFKFLKSNLFQGAMDEKYIMDKEGKEKWDIRNLSASRKCM
jgi:hypothetical protein